MALRRTPIRKKRPTLRRGELTPEEKQAARVKVHGICGGKCELRLHEKCSRNRVLPLEGDLFERFHLVHDGAKRRFGWPTEGPRRMRGGCYWCHIEAVHTKGMKIPPLTEE